MLYFPKTRPQISHEVALASSANVSAEGLALISVTSAGVFGAKESAGAANEKFLGFSVTGVTTLASMPKVEKFVQGSGHTYTVSRVPLSNTTFVWDHTAGAAISAGVGGWTLSGSTYTFQAGTDGHTISVFYRYTPSAVEAVQIQGDIVPGGPAAVQVGQVGVIKSGIVYTSEFDTSVSWMGSDPVPYLAANGRISTSGNVAINGVVISAPSADAGPAGQFLGIEFSAL